MTVLKEVIARYETDGRIVKCFDIGELIRCKNCRFSHITLDGRINKWCDIFTDEDDNPIELNVESNFYCYGAIRKKE